MTAELQHPPGPVSGLALGLAVVVINYRTPAMTIECAQTVLPQLAGVAGGGHLFIVENASGDDSAKVLGNWAEGREGVTLILSPTNDGFSGGNNRGMAAAPDAVRYLLLNSDAFPRPGAIAAMIDAMTTGASDGAGIVHPVLIDPDGTHQISRFRKFRPSTELVRGSGLEAVRRRLPRGVVAIPLGSDEPADWVSFACVMLDGGMVRKIGPMDEGYFLYFEDAEYAERAVAAGWRIAQAEDALVEHRRGGSSPVKALGAARKRLPRYYYESRTRYYRTRYGAAGLVWANALWLLGRAASLTRTMAGRTPYRAAAHEYQDIWTGAFGAVPHHKNAQDEDANDAA